MSAGREQLAAEPPILHTVEEESGPSRIGRAIAYSLARLYQDGGGRDGLPVVRRGGRLRVRRRALMERAKRRRVAPLCALDRTHSHEDLDDVARSIERALRLVDMRDDDTRSNRRRDSAVKQFATRFPER